jgi:hypothetical protein
LVFSQKTLKGSRTLAATVVPVLSDGSKRNVERTLVCVRDAVPASHRPAKWKASDTYIVPHHCMLSL